MMDAREEQNKLSLSVELALKKARQLGATQAEVGASVDEGLIATARKRTVETVEFTKNHGFGITVYCGQAKGSASTSDFSEAAILNAVEAAYAIARHTSADTYAGLADAAQMASDIPDLELDHPWELSVENAIATALKCEAAGLEHDARILNSEGSTVSSGRSVRVYGNSHGFIAGYPATRHGVSCALIAEDEGGMQRGYWSDSQRDASLLQAAEAIGEKAAQRALNRLGPQPIKTAKVPVLFRAEVASGLIGHFNASIAGGNIYRNSSFMIGKVGTAVFPAFFNLKEQPRLVGGASSSAFDSDGLATYDKSFVVDGVVQNYILSTYSGRKLGLKSTANAGGLRNVRIADTGEDFAGLLKKLGTGLVVTELMGQGINIVTGDYSRGAGGFWVENGEIKHPVQQITIAGNLADMFANMVAIGNDLDKRGNIHAGSILLEQMTVAGN